MRKADQLRRCYERAQKPVRLNATQGLIAVASFRPDYALNYE